MNNIRRKAIRAIIEAVEALKSDIDIVREEEQEAYDNMPESLQESERGEMMSEAIGNLDNAFESLEEALESLEEATN